MSNNNVHISPQPSREIPGLGIFAWIVLSSLILAGSYQRVNAQTLTGHEDFSISPANAAKLTHNFQASAPNDATVVIGEYFGRDAITALLSQPNCVGIRIYYGRKSNGTPALVLVGITGDGHDLSNGALIENGFPCPPICDTTSVLVKH